MLILAKITQGTAGAYAEYLEGKAKPSQLGDYYLKDGERIETPGRWAGGSMLFDLDLDPTHPVSDEHLRALMSVRRPDTGSELRGIGGNGEAVAALDATFSAPKSVSAVWAVAGPELRARVEDAHETAIDRALAYAIRQVPMLRRRVSQDHAVHEKAHGVVATSWRHTTARAVADQVPDPQLHSHVLLHAAVRRDGRTVAIDSRAWLVHQREIGAAYRTELARELTEIGFSIERGTGRGRRYFEIAGVPQALIDRWSSRHHQVQAAIRQRINHHHRELTAIIAEGGPAGADAAQRLERVLESGRLSAGEERLMGTITRSRKLPLTSHDLDQAWRRTATGLGLSHAGLEDLRHGQPHVLEPAPDRVLLEALTEFDATFRAWDARAVALERSAGIPIDAALEPLKALRVREDILVLADRTGTTRAHRAREHATILTAQRLTEHPARPIPAPVVAREMSRLDRELARQDSRLSNEQREAIRLACGTQRLVMIEGQAGTGKSTTLTGICRAHQHAEQQIVITSTAALAAERLAAELANAGVTARAFSTSALHSAIETGRVELGPRVTVVHDEAALSSTLEQHRLLDAVERSGARLIEIGDPQQNQPVGAGGLWAHLEHTTQNGGARVELTINQRAHDPADRRDQALFRAGETEQAIRGYHARERVHFAPEQRHAEDQALDAAQAERRAGKRTIVIAQTSNERLDELNARAQAIRQQHGELGQESVPVPGRPYRLHRGDEIQIRHTITLTDTPDRRVLRNGTNATIDTIDPRRERVRLQLTDEDHVTLSREEIAHADVRLAYIQHPFPAQGQTTDTAHVIVAEHPTREGTYVALTRARHHTHIYTTQADGSADQDPLAGLAERLSRSEPDLPSIHTPLAHETTITHQTDPLDQPLSPVPDRDPPSPLPQPSPAPNAAAIVDSRLHSRPLAREPVAVIERAMEREEPGWEL